MKDEIYKEFLKIYENNKNIFLKIPFEKIEKDFTKSLEQILNILTYDSKIIVTYSHNDNCFSLICFVANCFNCVIYFDLFFYEIEETDVLLNIFF